MFSPEGLEIPLLIYFSFDTPNIWFLRTFPLHPMASRFLRACASPSRRLRRSPTELRELFGSLTHAAPERRRAGVQ